MADNVSTQDLARFSPPGSLSPDNLKELSRKARSIPVAAGHYLFRDAESSDSRFFLVKGAIELHGENGIEQTIESGSEATRNALDMIGSGARASTDAVVLTIDRDLLDLMLTREQTGRYRTAGASERPE